MAQGLETPGLVPPQDPVLAARIAATVPGMAHFAGTGPEGATCRGCMFWGKAKKHYRRAGGELRRRHCVRFFQLMDEREGPPVPHHKDACRHFIENAEAPPIERPAKPGKAPKPAKRTRARSRKRKG